MHSGKAISASSPATTNVLVDADEGLLRQGGGRIDHRSSRNVAMVRQIIYLFVVKDVFQDRVILCLRM